MSSDMMGKRIIFAAILSYTIVISGCSRLETRREMKKFFKSTIITPNTLGRVYDRNIIFEGLQEDMPMLIIYNDSTECNSCQINQVFLMEPIFKLSDSLQSFKVIHIFSPSREEYDTTVEQLIMLNFKYPLYIDTFGDFGKLNDCIPEDRRFHCFFINSDGKPVFIGNPITSEALKTLFIKTLRDIS